MEDQQNVVHGLSNRAILNDLEPPQTQISRSGYPSALNICEMAKDTAIVTMEGGKETVLKLSNITIFNDLK